MFDASLSRLLWMLPPSYAGNSFPLKWLQAVYEDGSAWNVDTHEYTEAMKDVEACSHAAPRQSSRVWAPMLGDIITITHAAKDEFSSPTTCTYKVTQVDVDPNGSRVVCGAEGCPSVRIVCQGGGQ